MRLLFVCLGNICRSPMAEGLMRAELARRGMVGVEVDSAGTGNWHSGDPPDTRAIAAAARRGADIAGLRARQVTAADLAAFDMVLAMDTRNYADLRAIAGCGDRARIRMMMEFAGEVPAKEVPDPYYGAADGFERVLDLLQLAVAGLADHIAARKL